MRKSVWAIIGAVIVAGGGSTWYLAAQFKSTQSVKGKAEGPPILEFTAQELQLPRREPMPFTIEFSGALQAPKTATVRAKAQATLLRLDVIEGSRVQTGQNLGQLDLTAISALRNDRQAAVDSARAQAGLAQKNLESNQRLAEQNFISPTALDSQRASVESATSALKSAQAQLQQAGVSMRDAQLVAPIKGVVSKRHALAGEKLALEQAIVTIVDLEKLELAGSVALHEVPQLKTGQAVKIRVEGMSKVVDGKIERIAPTADTGTRSIGVYVVIDNPEETLRAGQYANAMVQVGDATPRLTVPDSAIISLSGQDYVWTLENQKLVRRIVTVGRRDTTAGRVEILTGLSPTANVLGARFDNLKEGAAAKIVVAKTILTPAAVTPPTKNP
jgi:RND family efflux transporter MFP subunit